ncbi:uncharacterized protein LOC124776130 [Schistocerca piceifrons]|uniref:uncharacterized protein LOC124776130 n=1 Tax=Schistocerca piceifrons TaxID=274613 RepID=UPI001F5F5339|nr:uncharacterized protein LOC124776130 [Schistocerca piceifrons]
MTLKTNKAVILVSSMHHSPAEDLNSQKSEILSYCNTTKGGVDEPDKNCSIYSRSRRTWHWPMCLFYCLLDISIANAYVLQKSGSYEAPVERGIFLKELACSLVLKHMQK